MASFLNHHQLHPFLTSSKILPCYSSKPNPIMIKTITITYALRNFPPTDRVIEFGKYKGRMLGTLPSNYLKWVSKTLIKTRNFKDWAILADQVLQDPVYKDRLEWEFVERVLTGDAMSMARARAMEKVDPVTELADISKRFGWDSDDKLGWRRVKLDLLGTSKGGRIPRVREMRGRSESAAVEEVEEKGGGERGEVGGGGKDKRVLRRERLKMKMKMKEKMKEKEGGGILLPKMRNVDVDIDNKSKREVDMYLVEKKPSLFDQTSDSSLGKSSSSSSSPIPGRETLLRAALIRGRIKKLT